MDSTLDFIKSVPVPIETNTYKPVSHASIVNRVHEYIGDSDFHLHSESYRIANKGNQVIGKYVLRSNDPDIGYMIMFKNSYDKTMSLGFATGGAVFICSNGMILSDVSSNTLCKKHVGTVREELDIKLNNAFTYMDTNYELIQHDAERMRSVNINRRTASELVGRMVMEENILNTMQMNIIRKAMERDPHFKWNGESTSVWNFYNNITESLKSSHPTSMIQDHVDAHKFVTSELLA